MKVLASSFLVVVASMTAPAATPVFAATCESLGTAPLKDAVVTRAEIVAAGRFVPPDDARRGGGRANPYADLPEFCRVAATLTPSRDSDIKVEVWLPTVGRQAAGRRQRRLGGRTQLCGHGGRTSCWIRVRVDRHRPRRRAWNIRP